MQKSSKTKAAIAAPQVAQAINPNAIKVMAIKLANIRTKVELVLNFLYSHNGPIIKRFFPKVSQVILLLEEVLSIISEKPTQTTQDGVATV